RSLRDETSALIGSGKIRARSNLVLSGLVLPRTRAHRARETKYRGRVPKAPLGAICRLSRVRYPSLMRGSAQARQFAAGDCSHQSPVLQFLSCDPAHDPFDLRTSELVRVLCQNALASSAADVAADFGGQRSKSGTDILAIARDQNSCTGREKLLDSFPGIGDQTGACSGRLEYPCCWRVADGCHAVARDIQDSKRRRIEGVVLVAVDVADVA